MAISKRVTHNRVITEYFGQKDDSQEDSDKTQGFPQRARELGDVKEQATVNEPARITSESTSASENSNKNITTTDDFSNLLKNWLGENFLSIAAISTAIVLSICGFIWHASSKVAKFEQTLEQTSQSVDDLNKNLSQITSRLSIVESHRKSEATNIPGSLSPKK